VTEPKLGLGGRNEKEDVASLGVAFGRPSLRRMCNDSRHRGRYTEPRESLEKGSLRLGRDSDSVVWFPAVFESIPVNPPTYAKQLEGAYSASLEPADIASLKRVYDIVAEILSFSYSSRIFLAPVIVQTEAA
jgi:hypothetical protein